MTSVTVHYHAFLREKLGRDSELLALNMDACSAGDVLNAFFGAHPEFARLSHSLNIAIDDEIVSLNAPVPATARVDILPPYGGG